MDETQKKSFVLFTDLREPLEDLSDEQVGKLFRAVLDYVEDGTEPVFSGTLKLAFSFVKISLDRNLEKYRQTVERRRAAGRAGGLASAAARRQRAEEEAENAEKLQANPTDSSKSSNRSSVERLNHVHVPVREPDPVRGPVPDNEPDPVRGPVCDPVHVADPTNTDKTNDETDGQIRCEVCGWLLTDGVAAYSRDKFGRLLCQKCQAKAQAQPLPPRKTEKKYFPPNPATVRACYQALLEEEEAMDG